MKTKLAAMILLLITFLTPASAYDVYIDGDGAHITMVDCDDAILLLEHVRSGELFGTIRDLESRSKISIDRSDSSIAKETRIHALGYLMGDMFFYEIIKAEPLGHSNPVDIDIGSMKPSWMELIPDELINIWCNGYENNICPTGACPRICALSDTSNSKRQLISKNPKPEEPAACSDLFEAREYNRALACSERATESNPTDISAMKDKADSLFCLSRYDEAISAYENAIQLCDSQGDDISKMFCLMKKSYALYALGRFDESREVWNKLEMNGGELSPRPEELSYPPCLPAAETDLPENATDVESDMQFFPIVPRSHSDDVP